MRKPTIALHLETFNPPALLVFSDKLYKNLLTSSVFTSPKPALAQQLFDNLALEEAIIHRGTLSNHGSTYDMAVLENADLQVRDNINTLSKWVMAEQPKSPLLWMELGFGLWKSNAPVGQLGPVQDFRQVINKLTRLDEIKLKWIRPLGTQKWTRITYKVLWSADANVQHAVQIGMVMNKCTFLHNVKGQANTTHFYWIVPVNAYGDGKISEICMAVAIRM